MDSSLRQKYWKMWQRQHCIRRNSNNSPYYCYHCDDGAFIINIMSKANQDLFYFPFYKWWWSQIQGNTRLSFSLFYCKITQRNVVFTKSRNVVFINKPVWFELLSWKALWVKQNKIYLISALRKLDNIFYLNWNCLSPILTDYL